MTLLQIKTRIENEINRSDLDDEISDAVQSAISFYETEDWGFNETRTTGTVATAALSIPLPSNFLKLHHLKIQRSGNWYTLEPKTWSELEDKLFNDTYQSLPQYFCQYGEVLYLYPVPEQTYTYALSHVHSLPTLSDSGTNAWVNECEEMIRMHSEADLYESVIRGPEAAQQAQVCRRRETEAKHRVRAKRESQRSSGRLRKRGIL